MFEFDPRVTLSPSLSIILKGDPLHSIGNQTMSYLSPTFLSLFLLTSCFLSFVAAKCHVDDENGLLAFKSGITSDPSGILGTWKSGTDCCTWSGVSCGEDNRVQSLSVYGQPGKPTGYLSGTISSKLSKLKSLTGLYLVNLRNISGPFPGFLFRLPKISYIYIQNNKLSGHITKWIGNLTQLEALGLSGNRFSGIIPSSISELTQLSQLNLGNNLLSGTIPKAIQQIKGLSSLSLEENQLSGNIPEIFTSFTTLRNLNLSYNKFSGNIPMTLSHLSPSLIYLDLGHNALTGQIPNFLGNFRTLDTLALSHNHLSGTVPKTFSNLTKIFNLDLSNNQLVDPFPQLKVLGIESVDLSYNQFNLIQIPAWITSSPIIYSLKLAKCGIKIKLDDWKPKETFYYDYIDLSENQISGSPVSLINRTEYLKSFSASGNQLKFNFESLKFPKTLKALDLSRNLVLGKIPTAISGLEKLNVSRNHLCGAIPANKFAATAFEGNDCLCGSPLSPCKKVTKI